MSSAHATGLGRLTVLSSLGQPLRAEIELTSPSKEEVSSLVPRLASVEAFRQANIDFNSALLSLRFSVEQRGAGYVIRISSSQSINEPFVDLLLELNSSNGKLLREYTFLLDPAELRNSQSPQVANPVSVAGQPQGPVAAATASRPAPVAGAVPSAGRSGSKVSEVKREAGAAGDYQVKAGDTLSKIAGNYRSEGVSLDQMLVSLYRANPRAFVGNNMNRLKSGQILTVPDAESVRANSGSNGQAHSVVMAHAADFNAYRNKLAGQVAAAPAEKVVAGKQTAGGTITAKVKEVPTATSESPDKLKLSKVAPAASAKGATGKAASEEDKLAKEKAVADANARVKELEKNVGDLQKLLEVKNKDLAAKQAEVSAKEQKKPAETKIASGDKASAAAVTVLPASSAPAQVAVAPVTASAASAPASAPVKPVAKRKPVAPPPPPPEPGFFDSLMDNPLLLPGVAILALLGGYGIFASRRKKKQQQFEDSILTGSSMKANSMFGSTGGQSVDTNNSVFNSNFAPSASQLDANEVDPVAEADVYIAYGRDSQAEEILKEALRTQPDRHAVRVKLLEIYFARKDVKMFERLASELYGMTSGEGEEWGQAASMGIALEPGNPLYAGGKAKPEAAAASGLGSGTQSLEDLDPDALLANSLSQDMLESISIIDTAAKDKDRAEIVAAPVGAEPEAPDAAMLDFDLDIPSAIEPEVPKIPEPVIKAPVVEEISGSPEVDFGIIDFDFGDKEQKPVEHEPEVRAPEIEKLELDLGTLEFAAQADVKAEAPLEPLPVDLGASANEEISLEPVVAEAAHAAADVAENATQGTGLPEVASAFEFDLSGIDLNLEQMEAVKSEAASTAAADSPVYNAEMATKLDLAVAYHEIGDKEGARELLDEVLRGGTPEQIEKAKTMLAQLS
ncbi:MAG: LysM peptidoglycan-binding domain-containing protein [Burkholderiales bacterium]|nr:LysM peptidoglycan-binding domain-containing protein [Burkholderiales bacterium]